MSFSYDSLDYWHLLITIFNGIVFVSQAHTFTSGSQIPMDNSISCYYNWIFQKKFDISWRAVNENRRNNIWQFKPQFSLVSRSNNWSSFYGQGESGIIALQSCCLEAYLDIRFLVHPQNTIVYENYWTQYWPLNVEIWLNKNNLIQN